jgi:hypothetical protein
MEESQKVIWWEDERKKAKVRRKSEQEAFVDVCRCL